MAANVKLAMVVPQTCQEKLDLRVEQAAVHADNPFEQRDAQVQARTGLATAELQAQLLALELQGELARLPGGQFVRVAQG